jgi:1-deoxy-D-xylulose-5-phosphate reductoisomerase
LTPSVSRSGQGLPDLSEVLARRIAILGSTGTVGVATLDVVRSTRSRYGEDSFPIEVLAAGQNVAKLVEQALEFRPRAVAIGDESRKGDLESALGTSGIEILAGDAAALEAGQRNSDWVMAAIVGAAGLSPTLAAVERGATVAIANKECVVAAGEVMRKAAEASNATLIPVDS